ncbi:hypothetical protein BO83DRAFT_390259 [Aspergillus eucalypticola CBS 122712]|uniref:Uncharacterized protein n=1 Tax=Aspergillus eucalypticola (strain CBS 122712 / IBT 29274) TaxID=1448314 RepID=A0A317V5A4_ASPEC|nr:uncharacterized protein BO83DRAFT_390259 [Aspergillus eucalypticola CBS 122712]PWY69235.1 hypothetical protein BO83DRAFT_390259 [Aspergillus eucalypticola CBS 122712]
MTGSACRWRKKTGSSLPVASPKSPALNRPAGNAIPETQAQAAPALANLDDHQPAQEDDWWGLCSSVTLESVRTNLNLPQFVVLSVVEFNQIIDAPPGVLVSGPLRTKPWASCHSPDGVVDLQIVLVRKKLK